MVRSTGPPPHHEETEEKTLPPNIIRTPRVERMDDETLIKHMEKRHQESLKLDFAPEPDRAASGKPRRLLARVAWEAFHGYLHGHGKYAHEHVEVWPEPDPITSSGNSSGTTKLRTEEG